MGATSAIAAQASGILECSALHWRDAPRASYGLVLHLTLPLTLSGLAAVGHLEEGDPTCRLVSLEVLHKRVDIGVRFPLYNVFFFFL